MTVRSWKKKLCNRSCTRCWAGKETGKLGRGSGRYGKCVNLGIYGPARYSRNEADRGRSLQEYEARETPESKLVKDLDRLELILQAIEYERCELSPWDEPTGANSDLHICSPSYSTRRPNACSVLPWIHA